MTEPIMADTPQEGAIDVSPEVDADNTATASPTENNETDEAPSAGGDDENNTQQDDEEDGEDNDDDAGDGDDDDAGNNSKGKPFHEHPRWKKRETEWEDRFNDQETRHQDDVKKLREEFGGNKKTESKPIPEWFGGDQKQWDGYQTDLSKQFEEVEKRALEKVKGETTADTKAVEDATQYMKSELAIIEADEDLNPSGKKVDPNKLLKVVMDNELVDSKGRWNYKAGIKIMNAKSNNKPAPKKDNKKKIAGATTSESKGESKPKNFKTGDDFKQERPW